MKETDQNTKGLLDVMYLIVCEYCGRVKWCNKWVHFSEVDKRELGKRKVHRKVITCKDCSKLELRNVELINQSGANPDWFELLDLWNRISNWIH